MFWINIPICVISIAGLIYAVHLHQEISSLRSKLARIDYLGMAVFISATTLMLYGLTTGGTSDPWSSVKILAPLVIGFVGIGAFLVVEGKLSKNPMVPIRIFSNRSGNTGFFGAFIHGLVLWSFAYYLVIFVCLKFYWGFIANLSSFSGLVVMLYLSLLQRLYPAGKIFIVHSLIGTNYSVQRSGCIVCRFLWHLGCQHVKDSKDDLVSMDFVNCRNRPQCSNETKLQRRHPVRTSRDSSHRCRLPFPATGLCGTSNRSRRGPGHRYCNQCLLSQYRSGIWCGYWWNGLPKPIRQVSQRRTCKRNNSEAIYCYWCRGCGRLLCHRCLSRICCLCLPIHLCGCSSNRVVCQYQYRWSRITC